MKWLIVRFSAIGDCVMAAHVPSRIRREQPECEIHWVVESRCAAVVDTHHLVNQRIEVPRQRWQANRWSPNTWRENLAFFARLRKHRYDFGLDLQGHLKTAVVLRIAKPSTRLAMVGTDMLAKRLNPLMDTTNQPSHSVERALLCLSQIFPSEADSTPIMPPLTEERDWIRGQLPAGKRSAVIAVSAGQSDKAYPLDKWVPVAQALQAEGIHVSFIGGPGDQAPEVEGASNWVGKLTLEQSMALIGESDLALAGDTGAGHIAAALSTPIVSVFGPTKPERFRPYTSNGIVLRRERDTNLIRPDEVVDAAFKLLESNGRKVSG